MAADLVAPAGNSDDLLKQAYGYAGHLADIPELQKILDEATNPDHPWTADAIDAAVRNSDWARNHSNNQVSWELEKRLHPQQAQADLTALRISLKQQATKDGFNISDDRIDEIADHIKAGGFNQDQALYALHSEYQFNPNEHPGGTAATTLAKMRQLSKDYMVPVSDATLQDWTLKVIDGTDTSDSFEQYLRDQAKSMYPTIAGGIDSGHTAVQMFDPYTQIAAKELGTTPETIDLSDPKYLGNLMTLDPKTGTRTMPSLDQWRTTIRTDPKYGWAQTTNAQNMSASFGEKLLQDMGKA